MSADLLGLDEFYSSSSKPQTSSTTEFSQSTQQLLSFGRPAAPNPTQPVCPAKSNDSLFDDDDDGWGDFADASGIPTREVSASTKPYGTNSILLTSSQIRPIRTNTLDIMTNRLIDLNLYPELSSIPVTGQSNTRNSEAASIEHMAFNHPSTQSSYTGCATNYPSSHVFEHEIVRSPSVINHDKSNVLFDVDNFVGDDVDEFGDFEGPSNVALTMAKFTQKTQASIDLLSLDLESQPSVLVPAITRQSSKYLSSSSSELARASPGLSIQSSLGLQSTSPKSPSYPQAPRSPSFQERNPYPTLSLKTPTQGTLKKTQKQDVLTKSSSPVTAWPSNEHSPVDEWPTFEDFPDNLDPTTVPGKSEETESGKKNVPKRNATTRDNPTTMSILLDWKSLESTASTATLQKSSSASPPTNIPPPSVLMSILPDMFDIPNKHLFKPLSGQSVLVKKAVMEDERTIAFLKGVLMLAAVSGRIIVGRKLRWHRDKFLSQSMTISAAGSKGMKLAGIDKAQSIREDREATDVIENWRLHVGRLRSAIAMANSAPVMKSQQPLRVPEISDVTVVQTAKVVPTAPKACALCGLKRDERILKIDHEVEDSFGEWWVEYWGHRSCKNFWDVHEKMLRSR